jgi:hypothetical protein
VFVKSGPSLNARLVHHTGTMLRFTTAQLGALPPRDTVVIVELPDGQVLSGKFHRHSQNPYVAGPSLVRWIKTWVKWNDPVDVVVTQVGMGNRIRLAHGKARGVSLPGQERILSRGRRLSRIVDGPRRRREYGRWERDPSLRRYALAAWGPQCQVVGCRSRSSVPTKLYGALVDVHHLNHVSAGGPDSPMNVTVVCATHHALIHRAPVSRIMRSDADGADLKVDGVALAIRRPIVKAWDSP